MLIQYHNNLYHQDMLLKKGYAVGGSDEFCLIETPSDVDNRLICVSNKKKINIWVKRRNKHRYTKKVISMNMSSKIDLIKSYFRKS